MARTITSMLGLHLALTALVLACLATLAAARDTSPAALHAKHAQAFERQAKALRRTDGFEFEKRASGANIKNITFSNPRASGGCLL